MGKLDPNQFELSEGMQRAVIEAEKFTEISKPISTVMADATVTNAVRDVMNATITNAVQDMISTPDTCTVQGMIGTTVTDTMQNLMDAANRTVIPDLLITPKIERISNSVRSFEHEIQPVTNYIQWFEQISKPLLEWGQQIADITAGLIENCPFLHLSKEETQALLESNKAWGALGWTFPPSASLSVFDAFPIDIDQANRHMERICTEDEMDDVFSRLYSKIMEKEDMDSAVFCYKNEQYKACALLLFSLIDGILIRNQELEVGDVKKANRSVGKKAVEKLKAKYGIPEDESSVMTLLLDSNLIACLMSFYANGDNFKKEPPTINRNFISHGMMERTVQKYDCIQLFLALLNLLEFVEFEPYAENAS